MAVSTNIHERNSHYFSNPPLISVIIPVYNVEPYLRRCLDSVIHNTYHDLEIICVNDGSTDHCLRILKEYAENDTRLRIIDKPNGGLPTARNAGIEVATGELIAHVDSDDWVHNKYFEVLVHAWEKTGRKADVVMCGYIKTDTTIEDADIDINSLTYLVGSWDLVKKHPLFRTSVWAKLYKRTLISIFRQPSQVSLEEDVVYNLNVLAQKDDLCVASVKNCQLYYYYMREQSIVHTATCFARIPALIEISESADTLPAKNGRILAWEVLFRHTLKYRYDASLQKSNLPKETFDCNETLRLACDSLQKYKAHSPLRLFAYRLLSKYPILYRILRFLLKLNMRIRNLLTKAK